MKPKTKIQKHLSSLLNKLPKIRAHHKKWVDNNLLDHFYSVYRSKLLCYKCSHRWKVQDFNIDKFYKDPNKYNKTIICPNCKTKLQGADYLKRHLIEYTFGMLDVIDEYQVVRIFGVRQYVERNKKPEFYIDPIIVHFINLKGKVYTMSALFGGFGTYNTRWNYNSGIEFRYNGARDGSRSIVPEKYYPSNNVLPELERNGFGGSFLDIPADTFFSLLLKNPQFEIILKAGQIDLLRYTEKYKQGLITEFWPSYRVAMKNKYYIEKPSDYHDYLRLLANEGKDILNPHYICPDNFEKQHDKLVTKARIRKSRLDKVLLLKEIEEQQSVYEKLKGKYFAVEIKSSDFTIRPLLSVEEFYDISAIQHHCIYANKYFLKKESLIMCAFIGNDPIETIEVNLNKFEVAQSRGLMNMPTKHTERIVKIVEENMRLIKKAS